MILVTGATGHLGKATAQYLLQKTASSNIAVLVRDVAKAADVAAQGVDVREGDYNDVASLVKAFTGIDKLFFVSGNDVQHRLGQQANVVAAAKTAGVKHIVYTSFQRKNETETSPIFFIAKSHLNTEALLKDSGITYTILKHGLYMDILPMFIGDKVLETGTIFQPAGTGRAAFTLRADMAEAAANILITSGHDNKSYDISGGTPYSYQEVADGISEITGKKIAYVSPTQEVFHQELSKAGVPSEYIGMFGAFNEAIKQGEFDMEDTTLEKLLGRKSTPLKDYLKTVYSN